MSIIIKRLDAPKSCYDCEFGKFLKREITPDIREIESVLVCIPEGRIVKDGARRPEWCPIIEIPKPHGAIVEVDVADTPVLLDAEE